MGLITTSFKISKTIRNISRLREIATVFAKNGLDEFISQNVLSAIPNFVFPKRSEAANAVNEDDFSWGEVMGHRLRLCFEELGPAFVKFGQLLSTREDFFDESFIKHMQMLRDNVRPLPFCEVKSDVEVSLGKSVDEVFEFVNEEPIGTASIGLVYEAKLKTGERVVLKVKRPGIDRIIETDLSILIFLATQSERAAEDIKFLGFSKVLEDFSYSLQSELSFNVEALNCEKLKRVISLYDEDEFFYIPEIYNEYSSDNLLIMELIDGIPFTDEEEISKYKEVLEPKLIASIAVFMRSFFNEGTFHADLHGGNFFYLKESQKIALIDFGLVGSLSRNSRQNFIAIIYSLTTQNFENLVYEFLDVAVYDTVPDVDKLIVDIKNAIGPHLGLSVQQTNFSLIIKSIVTTLREHHIFLPSEWFVVFRALITLDGVGKSLKLDLNVFEILENDINSIVKENFTKEALIEDSIWIAKDIVSASRIVPRHMKWFLKEWAKNNYSFKLRHKGLRKPAEALASAIKLFSYISLSTLLFYVGKSFISERDLVHSVISDLPATVIIFWSLSIISMVYGLSRHR